MPENTVDEVVNERAPSTRGGALAARPVVSETVDAAGAAKVSRAGVEEDSHADGGRKGRAFKASTEALIEKFEKGPAPHEMGDADDDEPADAGEEGSEAGDDTVDAAGEPGDDGVAAAVEGEPAEEAAPDPVAEWQTKAQALEQRNREILGELEAARKTPKVERTERETQLLAAEAAYVDEGSVPALRKFLGVIVGAAPDSKEVDAELAGIFTDLTARELGVALDQNQQALRDNARTRLLLARDKREKADGNKKVETGNSADETVQYEQASKHVDNLLAAKGQSGSSMADEYPMLMTLAEDFDGFKPSEVLARAIRQEIMVGTISPGTSDEDMIRAVAPKIERYYDARAKRIEAARAKQKKPDTTTPSAKPKVATVPSQEQRQSHGARTITNATASRAPAKLPKATIAKGKETGEKTRKDFPTASAWRDYLIDKHAGS